MEILLWLFVAIVGIGVVRAVLNVAWHTAGVYLIRRAGPRPLGATAHRIWRDPGGGDAPDPVAGPGGRSGTPAPPFHFIDEHSAGSQPTLSVRDALGRVWRVKWGDEVRSESFAVRFAHACGYFAEVTHFVPSGTIEGATDLRRTRQCVEEGTGAFIDARFELDDPAVTKLFEEHSWAWNDNPFIGTPELDGLKIVVMLLSNWDTKDRRDVARGSNTAIFEHRLSRWRREARYLLTDWGGSMGRWGTNIATRGRWDVAGFEQQTPQFVAGAKDGIALFGYTGQRTADVAYDIPLTHVAWFHRLADRVKEPYLVEALLASGATDDEAARFARAIRERVRQLGAVSGLNDSGM